METHPESPALARELAALEEACLQVAQDIKNAHTVREAFEKAQVEVPHHLRAIARTRVPTLSRLERMRDQRVEEIVEKQLSSLMLERNELVASRDFDRIKATDWHVLRVNYTNLYTKVLREANLILERKRRR